MSINVCDCGGSICADGLFDCKFKGNFKPKIMNEYRGFKVGDKVEVLNENKTTITTGTIERFGDRKLGGCAEPDTMQVVINCSTHHSLFDIIYLVSHELIEKLPKYAVGDAVRYNGKIATIDELGDMPSFFIASIYGEGRIWALTSELEPFDGFRVGDTVWSAKRGKGEIVAYNKSFDGSSTKRVFVVKFDNENSGLFDVSRRPKLSNLFPTERKMVESLPQKIAYTIPFPGTMPDEVAEMLGYKMKPKFKVDDVVYYATNYYGMKKWVVKELKGNRCVIRSGAHSIDSVPESDLRLWQETKYKGSVAGNEGMNPQYVITSIIPHLSNVKCIGKSAMNDDIFVADLYTGKQVVLFGTKGDDIQ